MAGEDREDTSNAPEMPYDLACLWCCFRVRYSDRFGHRYRFGNPLPVWSGGPYGVGDG